MMKVFRITVVIGLIVVLAGWSCQTQELSRYEKWQQDKAFTIGVMYYDLAYGPEWWKPAPSDFQIDPDMELFGQAGLNLLSEVSMSSGGHTWYPGVRALRAAGVPFMILGGPWNDFGNFQHRVKWFAGDKNFYGVQLADEPQDPKNQQFHHEQHEWITKELPHLLTLFCEGLTNIPAWTKEWEAIRSDAITFQWYPYHTSDGRSPDVTPPVYACLGHASAFCKARGLGFFMTRGSSGRPRSPSTLRLNTYASLAYGCDGFLDWKWGSTSPDDGYVWYKNKKCQGPSKHFEPLAKINREVANLGPALLKLRHVRTYQLNWPTQDTWAGKLYNFNEPDELRTGKLKAVKGPNYPYGDHLMVGFFRDSGDEEYFMVVNKTNSRSLDVDQERLALEVTLVFSEEVTGVERLNRETGEVEDISLNDHSFSFSLPGGTGDLFKYASDAPFAGISQ